MSTHNKPNYEFKSKLLKECQDKIQLIKKCNYLCYSHNCSPDKQLELISEGATSIEELRLIAINQGWISQFDELVRLANSDSAKIRRLKRRIQHIIKHFEQPMFITLTFTDDTLNNTTRETRKRYVTRFLKSTKGCYVANIDFGKENGREHYHCVIGLNKNNLLDYKKWHKYGAIQGEKIRKSEGSKDRLASYVCKLTNHAIKETATRNHLIYSRV